MANTIWNPADLLNVTLSGGNLVATDSVAINGGVRTVDRQLIGGRFYWEQTLPANSGTLGVGVADPWAILGGASGAYSSTLDVCFAWATGGSIWRHGSSIGVTIGTLTSGGIVGIAWAADLSQIWFRLSPSGLWNGVASADPATNSGGIDLTVLGGRNTALYPVALFGTTGVRQVTANFGDSAFSGTVPSGYTSGFTAGASIPTSAIEGGLIRETLLTTDGTLRTSGLVREVLRTTDVTLITETRVVVMA
jgi:hypothetical protein